jgi:hypothetical protein
MFDDKRDVHPDRIDMWTITDQSEVIETDSDLLEIFDALGPVILEKSRQGAVGQQLAPGLTSCAVVGLVGGVDDSLYR